LVDSGTSKVINIYFGNPIYPKFIDIFEVESGIV